MEPFISRRLFFQIAGSGVAGYFLSPQDTFAQATITYRGQATVLNTAKNAIFILLAGAPSQIDMFDLRVGPWTPENFRPATINGIDYPVGLMPNLAEQLARISIVRSMQTTALVHPLLQTWAQIARNPASATGKIAPNIGSIVALEFEKSRRANQPLPGFVSLNTGGNLIRAGYLQAKYAPFDIQPNRTGLQNLTNQDGEANFRNQYQMLQLLDGGLKRSAPYGRVLEEMTDFYGAARNLMYNDRVAEVFRYSLDDQERYGNSGFGNACIYARNLIRADMGTRYIQINLGGWDNHQNIYQAGAGIYRPASQLDSGLAYLISDLAAAPGTNGMSLLDETLIVVQGEFGRTVGALTGQQGRDHYFVHFALFAGGGVRGGRVLGQTTPDGRFIEQAGWAQDRPVTAEDVAATTYSSLGIDYSTVRRDDPLGRGFEYVPSTTWNAYPLTELFRL